MESEVCTDYDSEVVREWEILKYNSNYKIWNQFPYPIRKICYHGKKCKRIKCHSNIIEYETKRGYISVTISGIHIH